MSQRLRNQRLWELLEQFPRAVLYRIGRAAQTPVRRATKKPELLEVLGALPEATLERALIEGLTGRDLQALCARIGLSRNGTKGDLAARIVATIDEPAARPRWRPFAEARAFARNLALKGREEWRAFTRGRLPAKGALPADIPKTPHAVYAKSGWTGWGDFLATGNLASHRRTFRPFAEARAFAHSLALTTSTEWLAFVRGDLPTKGVLPEDIPKTPQKVYAKSGWTGWGDFLGTGNLASHQRTWRRFVEARAFARRLALRSSKEWYALARGRLAAKGTLPADVPRKPEVAYAKSGWTTWGDFLGTDKQATYQRTHT